ncbi:MAG: hypothetical protein A2W00_12995 [Candidatus Eisenbacteria bacterium RBG_16_71_46]|nr:MAG: hypothetical protein A2W00_12995 [Candidatus Eisenbacteria bacterium RBG_16_71_46]
MADRKAAKRENVRREAPRPGARGARSPFTLGSGWAAVLLALLVVIFFHQVLLEGKTFVAPDTTAPAGFVRMGEKALYQDHVYPLWNPYVFLGMPSFASGAYNPLIYPPDWPLALLQKVVPLPDMTWLLLYYFLGALFLFLLAREWGARPEGALLGAVAFVFAPNLVAVGSHGHGSQLVDSAYLPLLLWLATRWMRGGRVSDLAWLALAGGFQLLRGHVQICFYTWLAVGLYVAVEWGAALRSPGTLLPRLARGAGIAAAAAVAFGLAGFYNLPLRDYAQHSIRGAGAGGGVGMDYATQWSMAPYELPATVIPGWVGFGGRSYWGAMPFTDYPNAYIGMVAVVLALPAFLAGGAVRIFALILGALALLISFGSHFPLYGFLYAHLPLFNKFRVPVMVILLFQLAAALGLAWGWSTVLAAGGTRTDASRRLGRLLVGTAVALGLMLVFGVLLQGAWRHAYEQAALSHRQAFSADLARIAFRGVSGDILRAGVLGLIAIGAMVLAARGRIAPSLASVAVLLLLLIELWPVSGRVMGPVIGPVNTYGLETGRDDVVEFLEKAGPPGTFRVFPMDEFQSNRFAGFGIASLGGYHAAKPRLFQDFLSDRMEDNLPWLRLLNVRYIIVQQPLSSVPPFAREIFRGSAIVYEHLLALPRATVVGSYRVVRPARAILDSVASGREDPAGVTNLETDPQLTLGPVDGAQAAIESYDLNRVAVRVTTPGPALLRLADLWYPDWRATVDGREAPVLRADYLLRAVPVPAGEHRVVFEFRSPAVRRGLLLSLASLALVLAAFGVDLVRRRRAARPVAPGAVEGN